MKYYIVDDNIATAKSLESIIGSHEGRTVLGFATNPLLAIDEILEEKPDIVLVDFLMGEMDGVEMVEKLRQQTDALSFVMISKVTDKEMIQRAYAAGIEFFINKPINFVEVETVLRNLEEKIQLRGVISQLRNIVGEGQEEKHEAKPAAQPAPKGQDIDHLLGNLGMLGERGVTDIRLAYAYMVGHRCEYGKEVMDYLEHVTGDSAKNIEQRLRRAIKKGLTNAAAIAKDDMYSDLLSSYANYVFDFSAIREEMNLLRGQNEAGGRIKIARFMNGLVLYGTK